MKTVFRPRPACCRLQLTVKSKVNCSPAHFIFTAVTLHASSWLFLILELVEQEVLMLITVTSAAVFDARKEFLHAT